MAYYESMQSLIGNTPLVKLNNFKLPVRTRLFAKLELYNPAGSVKDRIGKYMIEDAERKYLRQDSTRFEMIYMIYVDYRTFVF